MPNDFYNNQMYLFFFRKTVLKMNALNKAKALSWQQISNLGKNSKMFQDILGDVELIFRKITLIILDV